MSLLSRLAVQAARAYGMLVAGSANNVSADYLVVAGGGGGGGGFDGGGGGAGGLLASTFTLSTLNTYSVTVGAGGNGGYQTFGSSGTNSLISGTGLSTVTSIGGGGGGGGGGQAGISGGSGGGGSRAFSGGTGTAGQGNNGGAGFASTNAAGGGGGAGAVGANATSGVAGNGGVGLTSSISGSSTYYAGGGGGSTTPGSTNGTGGLGGGGAGSTSSNGTSGTTNTGGGGGGTGGGTATGGSGGSGIVIISYTSATPKFVGGTITTSGGKQIHTFTSSGTLSPITPITASYLVVAGGGAGGGLKNGFIVGGGGGGAGGLLTSSTTLYSGATYVVTVGAGGAGVSAGTGGSGSSSSLSGTGLTTVTSTGGGGGGWNDGASGVSGGSGGGGANNGSGGTGTSGQGNNGGGSSSAGGAGGGGGASAAGSSGSTVNGGNGGAGTASSITGTSTTYAGGGGGGGDPSQGGTSGTGGAGGGGNAGATANSFGVPGTSNLGGGGGGCGGSSTATAKAGGNGGSGVVIISYAGSQVFNGGLVTTSGGNTIHTFTSTGALTPLTNNLTNSLRFRSSASAFLSRTFASTGTNNKIQTFSAWVKRGLLSSSANYRLMGCYNGSASWSTEINFSNDSFRIEFGGSAQYELKTTQVFRDPSAWYHFVIAIDTTQATAANRIKMYVNGNQITAFATANYPAQNDSSQLGSATANNKIGANWNTSGAADYFDGYMTDINFIDGQALEPYYFGNNDANGVWKPIQYKGTYGTNGFYLTFGNTTSTTTLGYDSSPNGNNWTCNNISLTAGTTYDAMTDVPTNTSATVANYATLNPLMAGTPFQTNAAATVSQGNLQADWGTTSQGSLLSTIAMTSGKWYFEGTVTGTNTREVIGIVNSSAATNTYAGGDANGWGYFSVNGNKYNNGSATSYGATYTTNDIIGVAFDADAGSLTFYKNNVSQGTAFTGLASGTYFFAVSDANSSLACGWNVNFGQRPFAYTPPTGFVALNTYNLPTPTILQGNKYMDATLYTGDGASTKVIVNQAQFKPDLVWGQARSAAYGSWLFDSVRGATKQISSFSTNAESTQSTMLTAFNSNGFNMGSDTAGNQSSITYVGWQWQAGQGTNTTNTAGSITSTVSVNTTAGFSIVTYTGAGGSASTVGHGLGVKPAFMIFKERTATGTSGGVWNVYFIPSNLSGQLNLTNAFSTNSGGTNGSINTTTGLTSSLFGFIAGSSSTNNWNNSGSTYVAYCWAEIAGFSRFGSYTGNGSTDGPFVYLGFRPKWVLIKRTDSSTSGNWSLLDSSINTYNEAQKILTPNTADSESTQNYLDLLSNGFKVRYAAANQQINTNGGSYIYAAFAENPFKNSNAR